MRFGHVLNRTNVGHMQTENERFTTSAFVEQMHGL